MKKTVIFSLMVFFSANLCFAQTSSTSSNGLRRNVATVMFAGLAGAVLGLSTLSFYGEPQEHIGNIWTGLGIGVLAGSAYVFSRNTKSQNEVMQWPTNPNQVKPRTANLISYNWDF